MKKLLQKIKSMFKYDPTYDAQKEREMLELLLLSYKWGRLSLDKLVELLLKWKKIK